MDTLALLFSYLNVKPDFNLSLGNSAWDKRETKEHQSYAALDVHSPPTPYFVIALIVFLTLEPRLAHFLCNFLRNSNPLQ